MKREAPLPFTVGQTVKVRSLNKIGIITELSTNSTARVSIGSLSMRCLLTDLESSTRSPDITPLKQRAPQVIQEASRSHVPSSLDLHGMRADDAVKAALELIDRAVVAGMDRVELIHGLGSGRVQNALHQALAGLSVVRMYKIDEVNPGVTRVFL